MLGFPRNKNGVFSGILAFAAIAGTTVLSFQYQHATSIIPKPSSSTRTTFSNSLITTSHPKLSSSVLHPVGRSHDDGRGGSSTSLNMFMGSDGGFLGIGAPEVATILLVGYFVLGPSDLYKLTKEIGKFIQNFRTLSTEATKTFENSMENQLQFEELRKAQRELNDAFSFRKSINSDESMEAFERGSNEQYDMQQPQQSSSSSVETSTAAGTPARKPKRRRRVKKKRPVEEPVLQTTPAATTTTTTPVETNIPDLDMNDASMERVSSSSSSSSSSTSKATPSPKPLDAPGSDWFDDPPSPKPSDAPGSDWFDDPVIGKVPKQPSLTGVGGGDNMGASGSPPLREPDAFDAAMEQERFQQQLSQNWNNRVMENEDQLQPLAMIMERIALLEEEKNAADKRLEEEFRLRSELEEKYYREKREILEESAQEIQKGVRI